MKKVILPFLLSSILLLAACSTGAAATSTGATTTSTTTTSTATTSATTTSSPLTLAVCQGIYSTANKISAVSAISGTYVSASAIAYQDDTALGTVYFGTASKGHATNMEIAVGLSGEKSAPVYGKIVVVVNGATSNYQSKFVSAYVDPYNASPSATTLNDVSCGATEAATCVKLIVTEAVSLYQA
jgi:hypothetical protein